MDFFWEKPNWEAMDKHILKVNSMPFRRPFPFIPAQPGLYLIRGPRQIGKTSWLKATLSEHCRNSSCFYLSCEEVSSYKELGEILRSVKGRTLILLDEVNFVEHWDRAVKHFMDSSTANIVMVTGSHAHDLRRGADRMPGRYAAGGEYQLLPMDFEEFRSMRKQAGWPEESRLSDLRLFFRIGGFPAAVAEAGPEGRRPIQALQTYWRWLSGDLARLGKQQSYLIEILVYLSKALQSPVSFQTIAQKTSIGSHSTVRDYINVLESCFALRTLHALDINTGAVHFKKRKKFYFTDPLLFQLALELGAENYHDQMESALAELVAHEALARKYPRLGYYSGRNGEVDFLLPKKWALEVKWSAVATNLSKAYLNINVPWKHVWTQNNFGEEFPI